MKERAYFDEAAILAHDGEVWGDVNFFLRWAVRGGWQEWIATDAGLAWPCELRGPWTKEEIDAAKARAAEMAWMLDDEPKREGGAR